LETFIGKGDWKFRYIRGRCCHVYRVKQGRKTRVFWELVSQIA